MGNELMERETNQDDQNPSPTKLEQSPRKPPLLVGGSGGGGDRLKRDEWSEGAVSSLLEAYESKWIIRNRAKLKGQDWEDVAKHVSSRANNTKSPKTQTQCKNKIESMKKRYRSESATADTSSWPLYSRLDNLLRGTGGSTGLPSAQLSPMKAIAVASNPGLVLESSPVALQLPPLPLPVPPQQAPPPPVEIAENSQESNGVEPMVKDGDEVAAKVSDHVSDKNHNNDNHIETDSSTPAQYSDDKNGPKLKKSMKMKMRKRRRREENSGWEDVSESIRWLGEAVVRSEQVRMDTMRELERMRVEAEAKRGEMDLKRTEIIANTQLEIARLFASTAGKSVDSSLRIGRS